MESFQLATLTPCDPAWPRDLNDRLEAAAPSRLWLMGNHEILTRRKVGLFCSADCPVPILGAAGSVVRTLDSPDTAVISGFHSPLEKECFRILLDDNVALVIGLARSLKTIRIPSAWRRPLTEGRLLVISRCDELPRSPTRKSSRQRNELIAAMSDEILILHAEPGGNVARLTRKIDRWGVPKRPFSAIA